MAPFPVDPSGGDGRGCARLGAGGTPALPGGIPFGELGTPAPDHRRSQLPAQQPLVLFILCILCIHVHKKISIPRRRSRLIQVEEMAQAVPSLVRAGRPRSREAFIP